MAYKNRKVFIEMCTSCLGWIDLFCRVSVNVACTVVIHWLLSPRALADFMFIVNSGLSDPTCLFDSHVFRFVPFPHVKNKPLVISPCKVCNKMNEEKKQRNAFAW